MQRIWRLLLGVCDRTLFERVEVDAHAQVVVAHVRPKRPRQRRCGVCGRRAPREDRGSRARRRRRSLDLGTVRVWLEADAPRAWPVIVSSGRIRGSRLQALMARATMNST